MCSSILQATRQREKESIVSVGVIDFYCQAKMGFCNTRLPERSYGWNLGGLLQDVVVKVNGRLTGKANLQLLHRYVGIFGGVMIDRKLRTSGELLSLFFSPSLGSWWEWFVKPY